MQNKRPEFFTRIIATAKDLPRWLTDDERGTIEEALCFAQRNENVLLAILAGSKFECLVMPRDMAEPIERNMTAAYEIGLATQITTKLRNVAQSIREYIYTMRDESSQDVLEHLGNGNLEAVIQKGEN